MLKVYVNLINKGLWTIEKVPLAEGWRDRVQAELDAQAGTQEAAE